MKKLITVKDVEAALLNGDKVIYKEAKSIVTPAAVDRARDLGIHWCEGEVAQSIQAMPTCAQSDTNALVEKVMHTLKETGLLDAFLSAIGLAKRFKSTLIGKKFQIQHVQSIEFASKNEEILLEKPEGSAMASGVCLFEMPAAFLTETETVLYVVCGSLVLGLEGEEITLSKEDVLHLPCGVQVTISPKPQAKVFFVKKT